MKPIRVTFDSNVWENVVFPDKHPKDPNHICLLKIKQALQDGRLQGFISEVVGTLEAITKDKRAAYFANRKPKSDVQIERIGNNTNVTITFKPDHNLHPDLNPTLIGNLQEARALGMRLLDVPCLNVPLPPTFLGDRAFYEPQAFSSGAYAEHFWDAAAAIAARGVGGAVIAAIVRQIEHRLPANARASGAGFQLLVYAKDQEEKTAIKKAIAEWADGDLVASHIGIENDLLCTEDQGRSAGGSSIFDSINRAWLEATYGVKFVTIPELAALLAK